jgi:hypothetical protein
MKKCSQCETERSITDFNKDGSKLRSNCKFCQKEAKNIDEVRELCHYSNLQPLWALDNIKKGNR